MRVLVIMSGVMQDLNRLSFLRCAFSFLGHGEASLNAICRQPVVRSGRNFIQVCSWVPILRQEAAGCLVGISSNIAVLLNVAKAGGRVNAASPRDRSFEAAPGPATVQCSADRRGSPASRNAPRRVKVPAHRGLKRWTSDFGAVHSSRHIRLTFNEVVELMGRHVVAHILFAHDAVVAGSPAYRLVPVIFRTRRQ